MMESNPEIDKSGCEDGREDRLRLDRYDSTQTQSQKEEWKKKRKKKERDLSQEAQGVHACPENSNRSN